MRFHRFIAIVGIFLSLSACVPGMAPKGMLSNPAGVKAPAEETASPSGPKDEFPSVTEIPSDPSSAVPRSLEVPTPPPLDGPKAGPGPGGAGGGGGGDSSGWRERNQQLAQGGGFCPKPDEVTLDDFPQAKSWRAFHGFGDWWEELPKTEPVSRSVGKDKPFDLYLNVQAYYVSRLCDHGWLEPIERGAVTVRLIFRPAARNLALSSHVDAPVTENTDGYNAAFKGITASDGLIDVYAYVGGLKDDNTFTAPPSDDAAFVADTVHARYLGSFATKVSVAETIRDQVQIPISSPLR